MEEDLKFLGNIKRTVLVVDDEEINRVILGGILEDHYNVLFAENGEQALEIMEAQGPLISLVLLDLMMPVMDGFEVIELMRVNVILKEIPIIVLTSEESAEIESLQKGAADFIKKPYDMPEKILARVKRIIALYENKKLIQSTERDELTGLLTRSYFFEYAAMQNKFHPERRMHALAVNMKHFHLYNELYGISSGESALKSLALGLTRYTEENGGFACRSEGDNFYLYVPEQDSYDSLIETLYTTYKHDPEVYTARIRVGVNCEDMEEEDNLEMVFERARMASTTIEENASETIAYYNSEMREKQLFEEKLIHDIANGIINDEIKVIYQPKYDITGEKPVLKGAEALVRWEHPEYGTIYPNSFISLFEENGMIQVLDTHVWRLAAQQVKEWKDRFGRTIPISVNVSRIDIQYEGLVSSLCSIAEESGIDYRDLHLEITESAYSDDTEKLIHIVEELRNKGFVIEMDDFGSGYSSLSMIAMIPIDVLKADMSFIMNMAESEKGLHMMELVIDIARFLKVPVIAEGVETKEQLDILREKGCQMIQGYYFSKPVPSGEFEQFIKEG
ncbi:MAG: EAL domain-containing protein [Lachnospiraceae bacterium]|nr:EAL domain-containing protein [Lachnospiraceae bacterium]